MIKPILTVFAAVVAGAAGISLASAQGYPPSPGTVYSAPPSAYPGEDDRPGAIDALPDFDAADDDQSPRRHNSAELPPPGPIMSPEDPRYGQPGPAQYPTRAPETVASTGGPATGFAPPAPVGVDGRPTSLSALPPDEQPEVDQGGEKQLAPRLRRQEVTFATKEPPGTLVVDTSNTYLYYILGNNRAIRYGVRVGRDGFTWAGVQKISRKAEWPDWHPPTEMIERQPYLPRFMAGGPGNPLGARAMYLGSTVYRIHGTNQPSTIGKFVSSGCIGMLNEDVSDLFDRVKVGTRVVVLPGGPPHTDTTASTQPAPGQPAPGQPAPGSNAAPAPQTASLPGAQPTAVAPLPAPVTIR
ncbi:ErfK/YbiS/YcfS/YnhG [Nitrobacter hamburgensis X14]|uniref:ErfK/YbiS/YcfS/YnhG n=2 Tax=Nitrobacter hamburgensis TaxID=912 RepID=Q1QJB6_NITHX|nr:ErfK/YbiS/YcfS/YnhG [Nitrobacter hamburgensis X14]